MILSLLADHGITPRRVSNAKGGEYHSSCPKIGCCKENGFHVWPEQYDGMGSFWCRGCGIGGDCIKFLMEYNGLNFFQAAERTGKQLDDHASSGASYTTPKPPKQTVKPQPQARECQPPAEAWQSAARELLAKAQANLLDNQKQLDYLAGRGLPLEAVKRDGLGWIGTADKDCIYSSRKKWGIPPKNGNKRPDALWIPRGILIPNIIDGRVDSLRVRRPKADRVGVTAKIDYFVIPKGGTAPLLLHDNQPAIVVIEAQLDGMLCRYAAGDIVGVLALGNSSAHPDERALNALKKAKLILVALDFEDNKAGGKAWERWRKQFDQAMRWPVPTGKDPGEAYAAGIDIRRWIQAGLPAVWREPVKIIEPPQPAGPPPLPEHAKGKTINGHSYVIAYQAADTRRLQNEYPDAVIFTPAEISQLQGMSQDEAELMLLAKKEFEGQIIETRPIDSEDIQTMSQEQEMKQDKLSW